MSALDTPSTGRPLSPKLRAYEAVYWLNRSFEATLLSLERLEGLGMFRREYLNEYRVRLEHTRARANEELIETMQEYEMGEAARFGRMEDECQRQAGDPDDVFFQARERKQAIREQIKDLQRGLGRQQAKAVSTKRRKRSR